MSSPIQGENDNTQAGVMAFGPARLALFLPALAIAVSYGVLMLVLWAGGWTNGSFARLCLLVLLIGVPLLVAHAGLRAITVGVRLEPRGVVLSRGFPARGAIILGWHEIADAGASGRGFFGGHTLQVEDTSGGRTSIHDLARADEAAALIRTRIGGFKGVATLLDGLSAMGRRGSG
jgi:hypothetical protein